MKCFFEVTEGDITSEKTTTGSNIKKKITDIINKGGKRKYKKTDYKEIIHLVDMDGAFLDNADIVADEALEGFAYRNGKIYAADIKKVKERNEKKQTILNILCSTTRVFGGVPYRVFYFSSNLEHVLHDETEVSDRDKMKYAEEFQDRYIDDLEGFLKFFCESKFTVKKEYEESWEFIKEGNNSISRFSNFNIVLKDYVQD